MNSKTWIFIVSIFVVFGLFIFWITAESPIEAATAKIENASSVEDLKNTIQSMDADLRKDEEVRTAAKEKIASFKLRGKKQKELLSWFPSLETALNIVIVPDLSKRLKDYPGQATIDIKLIDTIYSCFLEEVRSKKINPKKKLFNHDRLLVDVADPTQAASIFNEIADSLTIDLNQNRSQATRIWLEKKQSAFTAQLNKLYGVAVQQPKGTDYWTFIERKLPDLYQKDNLDTRFRNVLIILTDGYLEAGSGYHTNGVLQTKNPGISRIPVSPGADLGEWEIFVLEGRERRSGDNLILRQAWYNWVTDMGGEVEANEFYQFNKDQLNFTTRFIRKTIFGLE